jgi:prepilin-type N-terminal cleavage/methylation domain-containing protein
MQKIIKKNEQDIKKILAKNRGLTLIEMLVAIFVFSVTIAASMAVAATYLKGSTAIKKYQENNEELSSALNYISKDIRMSNTLSVSRDGRFDSISLTPNSGSQPVTYAFNNNNLEKDDQAIISNVSGFFYVKNYSNIPSITIVIWKKNFSGFPVETTVSMRSSYK